MRIKVNTFLFKQKAKLVLILFIVFLSTASAQTTQVFNSQKSKLAVQNLITGIQSENEGVKRSCIYFAGKYKVQQTVQPLIDLLKSEESSSNKYLISLSLYLIGDPEGIEAVRQTSLSDSDPRARRLASAVFREYILQNSAEKIAQDLR